MQFLRSLILGSLGLAVATMLATVGGAYADGTNSGPSVELPARRGDAPPTAIPFGGQIRNPTSNRCVDVQAVGTAPGTPVQLWDCNGWANQTWLSQNGQLRVYDGPNTACLSVLSDGIYVGIASCDNNVALQRTKWTVAYNGTIRSDVNGYCLAARSGGTANGTPLVVVSCDGAAREQWQAAFPTPAEGGTPITNPASGRCIDVPGIGTTLGTQVWLWDCKGLANQLWAYQGGQLRVYGNHALCLDADGSGGSPAGNGRTVGIWECHDYAGEVWSLYSDGTIRSALDGRCLSVAGDGTGNASPLILWDCTGASGQKWTTTAFPPTSIPNGGPLRNPASNRCMDVTDVGIANGTQVQLWDCNGFPSQIWLEEQGLLHVYGDYNRCLDADQTGGSPAGNGRKVQIWECNVFSTGQQWEVRSDGTVRSKLDGRCVAAQNDGTANGTHLVLWDCNGAPGQKWDTTVFPPTVITGGGAIKNTGSNRCLNVLGVAQGTQAQLLDCENYIGQTWKYQNGQLHVYGNYSRCLDADGSGGSPAGNGRKVGIWECHDYAGEQWTLKPDGTIRSGLDGRCLTAQFDGTGNGTPMVLWDCTGSPAQTWDAGSQGPHTAPAAPAAPTAVPGNASATVTWTAPADGGSPITGYTVTASPGGQTATVSGTQLSVTVTGLTNGTAYTFTVTATNAIGTSPASPPSGPITPIAPSGVPDAPGKPSATAGDGSATVSWPASDGNGSPITSYTVRVSPGDRTVTVPAGGTTTTTITGLTNGTAYTFTVTATNANGDSAPSQASDPVTPHGSGGTLEVTHLTTDPRWYRITSGHRAHVTGTLGTDGTTGIGGTIQLWEGDHKIAPDLVLTRQSTDIGWSVRTKRFNSTGRHHIQVVYTGDDTHQGDTTTITIRVRN